jgi:hypothetical protein
VQLPLQPGDLPLPLAESRTAFGWADARRCPGDHATSQQLFQQALPVQFLQAVATTLAI